jgi:hypothetical protein
VLVFPSPKSSEVRKRIDETLKQESSYIMTHELITWAFIFGAINYEEHRDLLEFNKSRNKIIHGHGNWWFGKKYKGALNKGIHFLEHNGM